MTKIRNAVRFDSVPAEPIVNEAKAALHGWYEAEVQKLDKKIIKQLSFSSLELSAEFEVED